MHDEVRVVYIPALKSCARIYGNLTRKQKFYNGLLLFKFFTPFKGS